MITPRGEIVVLDQKGYIPYLEVGSSHCAPVRPDDEEWFTQHSGGPHYIAAPAEDDAGEQDTDHPGEFLVEGPEPDPVEEPAAAEVGPNTADDEALGINVDEIRATEREKPKMVEHKFTHQPANTYCESCLCRTLAVTLTKSGQSVTLDHLVAPFESISVGCDRA